MTNPRTSNIPVLDHYLRQLKGGVKSLTEDLIRTGPEGEGDYKDQSTLEMEHLCQKFPQFVIREETKEGRPLYSLTLEGEEEAKRVPPPRMTASAKQLISLLS